MSQPSRSGAEFYELDEPVRLRLSTLWRDAVEIDVARVDVGPGVVVTGQIDMRTLTEAIGRGCFHSDDLSPADWDEADPVDLVLELRRPVAESSSSADALVAELFGDQPTPLHESESWDLIEATQTVPVPGDNGAFASFGVTRD